MTEAWYRRELDRLRGEMERAAGRNGVVRGEIAGNLHESVLRECAWLRTKLAKKSPTLKALRRPA